MKTKFFNLLRLYGLLSLLLFATHGAQAAIRYVKPVASGLGNGSSWANASSNLQAMIDSSSRSRDQVWVAAGTYKPADYPSNCTNCESNRDFTFSLKANVSVYGGFEGTETALSQRKPTNISILSGDIGVVNDVADNTYHVVVLIKPINSFFEVESNTLDGFTITSGNANGINSIRVSSQSIARSCGGGIAITEGLIKISNDIVQNNSAVNGGGIYIDNGTIHILNSFILSNAATYGGGIYFVQGNNANAYANMFNTIFANNTAATNGGGLYWEEGSLSLLNNTFWANVANNNGGGFYSNTRRYTGKTVNNIFWENKKGSADDIVGADYYYTSAGVGFNSISTNNLLQLPKSYYSVENHNGLGSKINSTKNRFRQNPLFLNSTALAGADSIYRTADDGLRFYMGSPALDAGETDVNTPTRDIRGVARIGTPDIGAYEGVCVRTLYVKPTGTGNGSSWANASADLQQMILAAGSMGQVWVAAGTYKPNSYPDSCTDCLTPRDYAFVIKKGTKIYGGFAGNESMLSERIPNANPTVLSGDLNGNDVLNGNSITNNAENVYHVVVTSSGDVTMDGFTVKGGNANGNGTVTVNGKPWYRNLGGGIYSLNGTNSWSNNTLVGNVATWGGGIYTLNSANSLVKNRFSSNAATSNGGGLYSSNSKNAFEANTFSSNAATSNGGGLYSSNSNNAFKANTFSSNAATSNGGGLYSSNSKNAFEANTFSFNAATNNGGGLYLSDSTSTLVNNTFSTNTATNQGGGLFIANGVHTLTNNVLYANTATQFGGGIATEGGTNTLANNIFWENKKGGSSTVQGADYYTRGTPRNLFTNNLLQLESNNYPASASGTYAIGTAAKDNLFAVDPLFVNAAQQQFKLYGSSLCFAAGNRAAWGNTGLLKDVEGNPRGLNGKVTMGIYEGYVCATGTALYVDASIGVGGNGQTWSTAFKTLSHAVSLAYFCDNIKTIHVAAGTYKPTRKHYYNKQESITDDARQRTFYLRAGVSLLGGYSSGGSARDPKAYPTILSGDFNGDDVRNTTTISNNAENAYNIITIINIYGITIFDIRVIDGFTIKGGNANGISMRYPDGYAIPQNRGGGIYLGRAPYSFKNNIISDNSATNMGGGVYADAWSNIQMTNNTILNNSAGKGGGIMLYDNSEAKMDNNVFWNNSAEFGGSIYSQAKAIELINNTIAYNSATNTAGGIYIQNGITKIKNNLFWGNKKNGSSTAQGAEYHRATIPTVDLANRYNTFQNNLLQLASTNYSSNTGSYPLWAASNNLFAVNPRFMDTTAGNFQLQAGSPCVNAGDTAAWRATQLTTDIAGNIRPRGIVDIGAYEYQGGPLRDPSGFSDASLALEKSVLDKTEQLILGLPTPVFQNATVRVYPTLVRDMLHVEGATDYQIISVATGRVVLQSVENQLNIAHLAQGMYLVHGHDAQGQPFATKIVLSK